MEFARPKSLNAARYATGIFISIWALAAVMSADVTLAQQSANQPAPATSPADAPPIAPPVAQASPLDGKIVSQIVIEGLEQIDESYVRNQMRTRPTDAYSQDQAQRDVARLLRTGRFRDVRAVPQLIDNQVRLVMQVAEKPEVQAVDFVGNVKFKRKDLMKDLPFAVGDPLDQYQVRQGRDMIERMYREKGYAYAEVTYDEARLKNNEVVYNIVENQRVRVRRIRFEGRSAFPAKELRGQIETKTYIWIFRTGDFDPDRVKRDALTIQQYYRDRGYLDAEVSWAPEFQDVARERLTIVFRINEGIRYAVKEVQIKGNTVYNEDALQGLPEAVKPGDFLVQSKLQNYTKAIQTKYGSIGYIESNVLPTWVFAEELGMVVLTLALSEGGQFNIGWIEVNGNFQTQEKCVRRELRFYPEELYDITKTRDAEKKLKETGLFSEATIEPVVPEHDAANTRDVLVNVKESTQTTSFVIGAGVSSDNGLLGNLMLQNTNFDIKDRPRSWGEFFRGRSFKGAGQTMRIRFEPGTKMTQGRVDFREPYFLDMPVGFNTGVYVFDRRRSGYTERRYGGEFSFDHKFEKGILKNWIGEIALRSELVQVLDRVSFAAKDIRDVDGDNFLTSAKVSLIHNTTDSRLDPSRGHLFSAGYEQAGAMGGDFFFGKFVTRFVQHFTLATDDQDRNTVLSLRAEAGQILGDAPVFERFYAGGIGSMRGFNFRGIGPKQGLRNNRVGGDCQILSGVEYSFPLYAKAVRGVFFCDMGTVEDHFGITTWRAAVGGGVRLTLDILGTVPMEFDLAIPISKAGEDDVRYFSFFVGLPFF